MSVVDGSRGRPAGIENVQAHPDRHTLTVTFSGVLPQKVDRTRFVIEGGQRVVGIRVLRVVAEDGEEPEPHADESGSGPPIQRFRLLLDRPGDDSTYRLRVVGRGFHGARDRADFTFRRTAPRPADGLGTTWAPSRPASVIDYQAKDYASFRRLLLERLSLTLPQWTERRVPDLWVTLVELMAHIADQLSYQQDAVATEAYLDTARLRTSVRRHTRLIGYAMHDGCAARTVVCVETAAARTVLTGHLAFAAQQDDVLRPDSGPVLSVETLVSGTHPVYRPLEHRTMRLRPEHNAIPLWAWGQDAFHLPAGTTRAALLDTDRTLDLKAGDLLVLEEVQAPDGGVPDPLHRQAIRLTRVVQDHDADHGTPVVKIAWAQEDALTFPLWPANPPGPDGHRGATVLARGNALLVEHGLESTWLPGGDTDELIEVPATSRPFKAVVRGAPVTWSAPHPRPADLAAAQARHLRALAARARELLHDPHQQTDIDDAGRDLLEALIGTSGSGNPRRAARRLSRFDDVLAPRLRRLDALARRAAAGSVLDPADTDWEIRHTWGDRAADLLHPANPALHGPASTALHPDPRAALPSVHLEEAQGSRAHWTPRRDLLESGPRDRHVVGESDDEGTLTLRFGDDRCGRAPRPGTALRAFYRVGNGSAGNAGSESINRIADRDGGLEGLVTRVRNPVPATGGTDPEPVAQARLAAPRAPFRTLLRAVTAEDYASLAEDRPGVQRAAAALRWTGSWYEADIALDPQGSVVPSPELLEDVRAALHGYRRIGHEVVTHPAQLVPLDVSLYILVDSHHVTADVRQALEDRLLPGNSGFFDPAELTFGTPVRVNALVALCMTVPGVLHAEVTRLRRLHTSGPGTDGSNVPPSGELRLRPLEIPRLDGDVTHPENGLLVLRLRGGR